MLPLSLVLAWSITADEAEVLVLIDQLGDERYAARIDAQRRLERILLFEPNPALRERVEEEAKRNPDLEIRRRAAFALETFYDLRPRAYPVLPWIDMLPQEYPERQGVIDGSLSQVRAPGSWSYQADWPDYRQATSVYARSLLRQGFPRHCVQEMLDDMVQRERRYREKHGMRDLAKD
jgi:hypothetical protein